MQSIQCQMPMLLVLVCAEQILVPLAPWCRTHTATGEQIPACLGKAACLSTWTSCSSVARSRRKKKTPNCSKPADHTWSVSSISPQAQKFHTFLLEIAQDGEKQLHTISSYFPKAISVGISHKIWINISSILVKPVLAQLSLLSSLVALRFEQKEKHSLF